MASIDTWLLHNCAYSVAMYSSHSCILMFSFYLFCGEDWVNGRQVFFYAGSVLLRILVYRPGQSGI